MNSEEYVLENGSIEPAVEYIAAGLKAMRLNDSLIKEDRLICEEIMLKLTEQLEGRNVSVSVYPSLGGCMIRFRAKGRRFSIVSESGDDLGGAIISRFADKTDHRYRNGTNIITVSANQPYAAITMMSVLAFLLAIPAGLLVKNIVPQYSLDILEVLYGIEMMFAKAMGIIATPITFLSLSLVIAKNMNLFENRGNYLMVLIRYIVSSFVAAVIGLGIGYASLYLFGDMLGSFWGLIYEPETVTAAGDITRIQYLLDFVPDSILAPFNGGNLVQVLFFAILFGVALGTMGSKEDIIVNIGDSLNSLFCRVLSILAALFPPLTFISVMDMMISNVSPFFTPLAIGVTFVTITAGIVVMCLFYAFLLLRSGINPLKFIKNTYSSIKEISRMGSSIDAIPYSIRSCHRNLGIPLNFLDFTIPLGANINMDGNCISLMVVSALFLGLYGINLSAGGVILTLIVVVLLSIGAPNQPGSNTICFAVLFPFLGLSVDDVPVMIVIDSLVGMSLAAFNVVGDMVTAAVMAKRAGIIGSIPDR